MDINNFFNKIKWVGPAQKSKVIDLNYIVLDWKLLQILNFSVETHILLLSLHYLTIPRGGLAFVVRSQTITESKQLHFCMHLWIEINRKISKLLKRDQTLCSM